MIDAHGTSGGLTVLVLLNDKVSHLPPSGRVSLTAGEMFDGLALGYLRAAGIRCRAFECNVLSGQGLRSALTWLFGETCLQQLLPCTAGQLASVWPEFDVATPTAPPTGSYSAPCFSFVFFVKLVCENMLINDSCSGLSSVRRTQHLK